MEMQLAKLVQKKIVVLGSGLFDSPRLETVTLLGVEQAGIWVESDYALDRIADKYHLKPAAPAALFIPFAQITSIIASGETEAGEGVAETAATVDRTADGRG